MSGATENPVVVEEVDVLVFEFEAISCEVCEKGNGEVIAREIKSK